MIAALVLATAALPLWTEAKAGPRPSGPPSIPALLETALPAVVGIVATTQRQAPASDPFHELLERTYGPGEGHGADPVRGIGTGFFIRADGLIVTNNHVVEGATDVSVQVGAEGDRVYRATVVGRDEATDLALLRIDGGPFPVLPLGDSDRARVGEWVVAIGNPFGLSRTVTTGIISSKGRRDLAPTGHPGYFDFIQTDAAINPGNSGGPLLDARGAVIAINAAVNPSGQGIGFAVPIAMFKELAPQLAARGRVRRGWMGLSAQERLSPELAESFHVPGGRGVLIVEVAPDGPAARAGLRAGDVVTAFGAEPVADSFRLRWLAALAEPGRPVKLGLLREGARLEVVVVPAEKPDAAPAGKASAGAAIAAGPYGLVAEDRKPGEKGEPARGVQVGALDVRGSGFRAGLREGDVILELDGHPVDDRASFERLAAAQPAVARLLVQRGPHRMYVGVRRDSPPQGAPPPDGPRAP